MRANLWNLQRNGLPTLPRVFLYHQEVEYDFWRQQQCFHPTRLNECEIPHELQDEVRGKCFELDLKY